MKRLGQSYESIMKIPMTRRYRFVKQDIELEKKKAEYMDKQAGGRKRQPFVPPSKR